MSKSRMTLPDEFINDLKYLQSLKENELKVILKILVDAEDPSDLEDIQNKILKKYPEINAEGIVRLIVFFITRPDLDKFLDILTKYGITFQKDKIKKIINEINDSKFSKVNKDIREQNNILNKQQFGLPHFASIQFQIDYRIINESNKKKFVPVIICKLELHNDDKEHSDKIEIFQFLPDDLEYLKNYLVNVINDLREETNFIKKIENKI